MNKKFGVVFLQPAKEFMDELGSKAREKILFNIRKAQIEKNKINQNLHLTRAY